MDSKEKFFIYPEVLFISKIIKSEGAAATIDTYYTTITTEIRKLHKGKWYRQRVVSNFADYRPESVQECINDFQRNVYLAQNFSQVVPEMKDTMGFTLFPLDEDQRTEEERLKQIYL
jgi:hypothetical protein